jgi:hypothetical protein
MMTTTLLPLSTRDSDGNWAQYHYGPVTAQVTAECPSLGTLAGAVSGFHFRAQCLKVLRAEGSRELLRAVGHAKRVMGSVYLHRHLYVPAVQQMAGPATGLSVVDTGARAVSVIKVG